MKLNRLVVGAFMTEWFGGRRVHPQGVEGRGRGRGVGDGDRSRRAPPPVGLGSYRSPRSRSMGVIAEDGRHAVAGRRMGRGRGPGARSGWFHVERLGQCGWWVTEWSVRALRPGVARRALCAPAPGVRHRGHDRFGVPHQVRERCCDRRDAAVTAAPALPTSAREADARSGGQCLVAKRRPGKRPARRRGNVPRGTVRAPTRAVGPHSGAPSQSGEQQRSRCCWSTRRIASPCPTRRCGRDPRRDRFCQFEGPVARRQGWITPPSSRGPPESPRHLASEL